MIFVEFEDDDSVCRQALREPVREPAVVSVHTVVRTVACAVAANNNTTPAHYTSRTLCSLLQHGEEKENMVSGRSLI